MADFLPPDKLEALKKESPEVQQQVMDKYFPTLKNESPEIQKQVFEKYGVLSEAPRKPLYKYLPDPLKVIENAPKNLWEGVIKPLGTAIRHPIDTLKGIGTVAAGGIVEGATAIGIHGDPQKEAELKQTFENFGPVKAITESVKDPAGIPERMKSYIEEKPAQALQAVSMGSALLKKGASAVGMTKTAETLDKAATALDPVNATLSVAGATGKAGLKAGGAFFGGLTGKGTYAFEQAGRPGFFKQLWGKSTGEELVDKARQGLTATLKEGKAEYKAGMEKLRKEGGPVNFAPIGASLQDKLDSFNINYKHGGFNRLISDNYPKGSKGEILRKADTEAVFGMSTADKAAIPDMLEAVKTVHKWGKSKDMLTPEGLDILKRKFGNMYSETDNGRAMISSLYSATKQTIVDQFPKYKGMMSRYSDLMEMEYQMGTALGIKDLGQRQASVNTALNKFISTLKEDSDFRRSLLERVSKGPAKDLPAEIAGYSMRGWMPTGLVGKSADWGALVAFLYTHNPKLVATFVAASPKITGSAIGAIRLAAEKAGVPLKAAAKATTLPRQVGAVAGKEQERQQEEQDLGPQPPTTRKYGKKGDLSGLQE